MEPLELTTNSPESKLFSNFKIEKFLGSGGYSLVCQAGSLVNEKKFALKISSCGDPDLELDPKREVANLLRLPPHPSILTYFDSWEDFLTEQEIEKLRRILKLDTNDEDKLCLPEDESVLKVFVLQTELCSQDLLKYLSSTSNFENFEEKLRIAIQISSGLRHIHSHDLIHRDLKPDNVYLTSDLQVKIGDFGNSTIHKGGDSAIAKHTRMIGSRGYAAPELQKSNFYTQRVDLFALGLVIFDIFYPMVAKYWTFKNHFLDVLKENRTVPTCLANQWPEISKLIVLLTSPKAMERPSLDKVLSILNSQLETILKNPPISELSNKEDENLPVLKYKGILEKYKRCCHCESFVLIGTRFYCPICPNFNVCERCREIPGIHPESHPLLELNPAPPPQVKKMNSSSETHLTVRNSVLIPKTKGTVVPLMKSTKSLEDIPSSVVKTKELRGESFGPLINDVSDEDGVRINLGFVCLGCKKRDFKGQRHTCRICKEVHLCTSCYTGGIHFEHKLWKVFE